MARPFKTLHLTEEQISELEALASNPLYAEAAIHAKIVLECSKPAPIRTIAKNLGVNKNAIKRWRDRYVSDGIGGLYPRHGGGKPQCVDHLDRKILELLAEKDGWTVPLLAERTGATETVVRNTLRKLDITLHRNRLWTFETREEPIEKSVDVVGVYLSPETRMIVFRIGRSHNLLSLRGMVSTRNSRFAHALEKKPQCSLVQAILTASRYAASSHGGPLRDPASFLKDVLSNLPSGARTEYHLMIQSSTPLRYKGRELTDIFPVYVDTEEQWLDEIRHILTRMTVRENPGFADEFADAVRKYSLACTDKSAPFLWKKLISPEESHDTPVSAHPLLSGGTGSFEDHLRKLFPDPVSDDELQCAMIAVVRGRDGIRYSVSVVPGSIPCPGDPGTGIREECTDALNQAETLLEKLRDDAADQVFSMWAGAGKSDPGPQPS